MTKNPIARCGKCLGDGSFGAVATRGGDLCTSCRGSGFADSEARDCVVALVRKGYSPEEIRDAAAVAFAEMRRRRAETRTSFQR